MSQRILSCGTCAYVLLLVPLAACHKKAPAPEIRPVRSILVHPSRDGNEEFLTGQVAPHRVVNLSFRLPGKIVERKVAVGDGVHAGQLLARLDDTESRQTLRAATADAQAAKAALAQATPLQKRATALLPDHAISRNDYDEAILRYRTSREAVQSTEARERIAREELDHTRLIANTDGVITERLAEVGEVVSAGQTILRMAEAAGRDAQFDISGDILRSGLTTGAIMDVCLDANRHVCSQGTLYELAPDADPLTRNYHAKVLLQTPPPGMTLGSVVIGRLADASGQNIHLPPSALTAQNGKPAVWVINSQTMTVTLRSIEVSRYAANDVTVASGLHEGERVVTAGVQALYPNQKITLLDDADVRP
ncbi:efflux RND transporter periplasmic adaptor subunit [Acetobacter oryzoeni]|uniref:Efflux RND transporter periplasmic adaptor subunit n=1 Tax=Acetobacter oryzoeni TaxID=2500548 RepID=A0A5B9GPI3_9PROT|nr:efflux RND transporter periplasmic adaptor subunit [Acetobacter oryzoeni]MCP1202829.1 efflux RND transporter periplasmic adaptor subunit [Acetobacter oryzoeni]QEE85545.1 efflux RND transporter periplasmic adaptor subunit [Acetobacter oryzoeni]